MIKVNKTRFGLNKRCFDIGQRTLTKRSIVTVIVSRTLQAAVILANGK